MSSTRQTETFDRTNWQAGTTPARSDRVLGIGYLVSRAARFGHESISLAQSVYDDEIRKGRTASQASESAAKVLPPNRLFGVEINHEGDAI